MSGECNWCGNDHTEADCEDRPDDDVIGEFVSFGNVDGKKANARLAELARRGAQRMPTNQKGNYPSKIQFEYTNWKGRKANRTVRPHAISFRHSDYHGYAWVLDAYDVDKDEYRSFAIKDISGITLIRLEENDDKELLNILEELVFGDKVGI